mgnify:CR=1 FL=1
MKIHQNKPFEEGYHAITELNGKCSDMMMDFGILKLKNNTTFEDTKELERIYVLLYGEIQVTYNGKTVTAKRHSFLDDDLWCLDMPKNGDVKITRLPCCAQRTKEIFRLSSAAEMQSPRRFAVRDT